ncbi:MAG TPA: hypothetical protein VMP11_10625 [Verrucomicrobiae bacterium]|nr:hypothetical protein [Verrucomicrobiae bacterium]
MKTRRQTIVRILKERGESLLGDRGVDERVARKIADEILEAMKPKVVVEVSGGIAHTVYATMPMDVTIRDHDNIKEGDKDPLDGADLGKSKEYQEVY